METVFKFKVGDVVYDNTTSEYKGKVVEINLKKSTPVLVRFDNDIEVDYTLDGRLFDDSPQTLSFKPYSLDICQERPIELELPEVGEEIMVSNDNLNWVLEKFIEYNKEENYPIITNISCYKHFKRLR